MDKIFSIRLFSVPFRAWHYVCALRKKIKTRTPPPPPPKKKNYFVNLWSPSTCTVVTAPRFHRPRRGWNPFGRQSLSPGPPEEFRQLFDLGAYRAYSIPFGVGGFGRGLHAYTFIYVHFFFLHFPLSEHAICWFPRISVLSCQLCTRRRHRRPARKQDARRRAFWMRIG